MSDIQIKCRDCYDIRETIVFYSNPNDVSYLEVMNNGQPFTEGEHYTITATVEHTLYTGGGKARCYVERDNVMVYFTVTFTEEYRDAVSSLNKGDVITFRGKASPEGRVYWMDCELIVD